jgi:hypothetical protein
MIVILATLQIWSTNTDWELKLYPFLVGQIDVHSYIIFAHSESWVLCPTGHSEPAPTSAPSTGCLL